MVWYKRRRLNQTWAFFFLGDSQWFDKHWFTWTKTRFLTIIHSWAKNSNPWQTFPRDWDNFSRLHLGEVTCFFDDFFLIGSLGYSFNFSFPCTGRSCLLIFNFDWFAGLIFPALSTWYNFPALALAVIFLLWILIGLLDYLFFIITLILTFTSLRNIKQRGQ